MEVEYGMFGLQGLRFFAVKSMTQGNGDLGIAYAVPTATNSILGRSDSYSPICKSCMHLAIMREGRRKIGMHAPRHFARRSTSVPLRFAHGSVSPEMHASN